MTKSTTGGSDGPFDHEPTQGVQGPTKSVEIGARRSFEDIIAEANRDFAQCFIQEAGSDNIRFTSAGLAEYRGLFGRAGIDITTIKTRSAFNAARDKSNPYWLADLRELVKGHKEIEDILKTLWS
jgi:hypothetical protein